MKQIILILTLITTLACNCQNKQSNAPSTTNQPENTQDSTLNILPSKNILLGKFTPSTDSNFVVIPNHMSTYEGLYCEKQTFQAYLAMRDSALKEGITLTIVSATRTFDRQSQIWERKWANTKCPNDRSYRSNPQRLTSDKTHNTDSLQLSTDICKIRSIMRYSSMPGTSRHHWGTDLDFISVEPEDWTHGEGLRIYNWLCANAHKFGFFQPYTADPTRTGYAEERWHWSYAPLSKPYLQAYQQKITAKDITGFSGSYLIDSLNIIQTHVLGISQ